MLQLVLSIWFAFERRVRADSVRNDCNVKQNRSELKRARMCTLLTHSVVLYAFDDMCCVPTCLICVL